MVRATCTLQTLLIANNHLKSVDDVRHVIELPALSTLDVQDNEIEDPAVRPTPQTAAPACVLAQSDHVHSVFCFADCRGCAGEHACIDSVVLEGQPCCEEDQALPQDADCSPSQTQVGRQQVKQLHAHNLTHDHTHPSIHQVPG